MGTAYRLLGNCAEAKDLCAETLLRAFQHLDALRADPSIIHWLLRVASNLGISLLRHRTSRPVVELDEARELPTDALTPKERVLESSRQEVVRRCLDRWPPKSALPC